MTTLREFRDEHARGGPLWTMQVNQVMASAIVQRLPERVTPNQLTLASMSVGCATSVVAATLAPTQRIVAAIIALVGWQLAYTFDCADGQLARWRDQTSVAGGVLDLLGDYLVHLSVIAAGLHMAQQSIPERGDLILTAVLAGGWLANLFYTAVVMGRRQKEASTATRSILSIAGNLNDYGLQTAVLAIAIAISPAFVLVMLVGVAAMSFLSFGIQMARWLRS